MTIQVPPLVGEAFRFYLALPDAPDFKGLDPENADAVWEMWSECRYWFERHYRVAADWMDWNSVGDFFTAMRDGYEVVEATKIETEERDWIPWGETDPLPKQW